MKSIWRRDPQTFVRTKEQILLWKDCRYNWIKVKYIIPGDWQHSMTILSLSSTVIEVWSGNSFAFKAHKWTLMDSASQCNECLSYNTSMPNCGNVFSPECKHDCWGYCGSNDCHFPISSRSILWNKISNYQKYYSSYFFSVSWGGTLSRSLAVSIPSFLRALRACLRLQGLVSCYLTLTSLD